MTTDRERSATQEHRARVAEAAQSASTGGTAAALADLMEGAKALQAVQQQAAIDAQRLPNPRLDQPEAGTTKFIRDNGDQTFTVLMPNGDIVENGADLTLEAATSLAQS